MSGTQPPRTARIAVGIATRGRAAILRETLRELQRQTRRPDRIIIAHVEAADVANLDGFPALECLTAAAGLPCQRNAILDVTGDCDILVLLDDDFLPDPTYLAETLAVFERFPDVAVTTGLVLADGARGPGVSLAAARDILAAAEAEPPSDAIEPTFNGYGCNMAVRLDLVRAHKLRFDERLPLYAWYEDVDFCRRLSRHGGIVWVRACRGVHLGTKLGRTSGIRLGYSQLVNPLYLWRKGSTPFGFALRSAARHFVVNGVRAIRPEPWVDRRGRLRGNSIALVDILRGRARPERILDL